MEQAIKLQEGESFMTLGKLLKYKGIIGTGGLAKWFLSEHDVYVNDEHENRRGKKLFAGDKIVIEGQGTFVITQ